MAYKKAIITKKVNKYEAYELYKKGLKYYEIGNIIGVSVPTISAYIHEVLDEIAQANTTDLAILRAELKDRLLTIAAEAMQGWEGSKEFASKKIKKKQIKNTENEITESEVEVGHGDVRFLQVATDAIQTIGDIYGATPSTKAGGGDLAFNLKNEKDGSVTFKTTWGMAPKKEEQPIEVEAEKIE